MIKTGVKKILHKKGLYYSLKYSRLFSVYQWLFKPAEIKQQKKEISFYKSFLPVCNLIFDIGANDGHKTAAFLHIAGKVVCCEPDEENYKILQTRFRNKPARVIIENKALSDKAGAAIMNIHHPGSAFNTLSDKWAMVLENDNRQRWDEQVSFSEKREIETTTLDQLIDQYGLPDFIKIDVEGFEEKVLMGLSHPVQYISFETLLPDYANELSNSLAIIESLGHSAIYNIALHEKLILPGFVSKAELEKWLLANNTAPGFEVVVKMSI